MDTVKPMNPTPISSFFTALDLDDFGQIFSGPIVVGI